MFLHSLWLQKGKRELVVILCLLWNTGCCLTGAAWSLGQGSDPVSPVRFFGGCG